MKLYTLLIALFIYFSNDTKTLQHVDQEKQDIFFSCKHEKFNTLKSMEFFEGNDQWVIC